jgi:hypothetical protein
MNNKKFAFLVLVGEGFFLSAIGGKYALVWVGSLCGAHSYCLVEVYLVEISPPEGR